MKQGAVIMLSNILEGFYLGLTKEWKTAPWTVMSVVLLWLFVVTAYFLVYPTLAHTDDVKPLKRDITLVITKQYEAELLDTRVKYCQADSKTFFASREIELARQYRELTNQAPPILPPCEGLQ